MIALARHFEYPPHAEEPGGVPFFESAPSECFCCGEKLTIPCVMWHGATGQDIWLHPPCALNLAMGLVNDVEEQNYIQKGAAALQS